MEMHQAIINLLAKFKKFANEKVNENTARFECYTNMSMSVSYMEVPATFNKN